MYKCCASQDGICRNTWLYGTECDGYKEKCKLRGSYKSISNAAKAYQHAIRKAFGAED
ncbi:hypothetical protein [Blautia sp. HCN-1074]|uniref:Uncharacterized protein n=1 Tax=Myoviridae sp. ctMne5 TaxID=2825089 RepID=A0A8S5TZY3_9CAUD|nr:MAG TPA: hypothetical protein [Myoviridae sp. ctMne5]